MNTKKYILIICAYLCSISAFAQQKKDSTAIVSYIQKYKDIAIEEMKRSGIPASITMAQGIHESSFGTSYLASKTNNHFGIKCKETWTGKTFKYTDDAPNECFRVYDNVEDSYKDHSDFLKNRPYYQPLFKLNPHDYKAWAYGLKKSGYATNPKYAEILIKTIEDYQLNLLDSEQPLPYLTSTTPTVAIKNDTQKDIVTQINIPQQNTTVTTTQQETTSNVTPIITTQKISKTIFKVNHCKAIKIYPSKGETLDLISNVLNIDKDNLMQYNDITNESVLKDGMNIFLHEKKKSNKEERTYKVKQEDNIWSIAQAKGIRLASLLKMNKLEPGDEPAAKEVIVLKGELSTQPKLRKPTTATVSTKDESNNKIVRARDTIYPPLKDESKLSVDSNKLLGWESDTKLLEKTTMQPYTIKKDSSSTTVQPTKQQQTPTPPPADKQPATTVWNPAEKTVYPSTIDYNKLPKSDSGTHTVTKGDTMYNICKRYNITVAQVMKWNNLSDQNIKLGQVLTIHP